MRFVFVGAGTLSRATAGLLLRHGHDVVVVERDEGVIESLGGAMDWGVLHGDGTRPAVLREAGPEDADALLCLTGNDQTNIIASLVGRSLGYRRVLTRIGDEEFEHICAELGLEDTIIPTLATGRYLVDMVEGRDTVELSAAIRGDARLFLWVAREGDEGRVEELDLPGKARVTHLYRGDQFVRVDPSTRIEKGDEVVALCSRAELDALRERFGEG